MQTAANPWRSRGHKRPRQAAHAAMEAAKPRSVPQGAAATKDADGTVILAPDDGTRIEIPA